MWVINPIKPFENWQPWCDDDHYVPFHPLRIPRNRTEIVWASVGKKRANWTEANSICHSFGANVASIHNDQENNFVRRLAVSKGLINGVMLVGTIYSPEFPYTSSEPCDFLLKVDSGMLVEVEILFLEANECCDHLMLFEGTL
uniref:C-type lectin n=1 Tax=Pristionchus pacificus TaxID=54126 RepID=A0A2A6BUQ5_PRIPA|eukprot:PDM69650.1 C-type lectin [Pristionchus pacificus]